MQHVHTITKSPDAAASKTVDVIHEAESIGMIFPTDEYEWLDIVLKESKG